MLGNELELPNLARAEVKRLGGKHDVVSCIDSVIS
jgi:hypothetical protein